MYKEEFIHLPKVYVNRSTFNFRPRCTTTLNVGDLVPLYKPIEVVPGDTFQCNIGSILELTPMLSVVFDILLFDVFWFYVPYRLLWSDYKYFYGENKQDPYDSIGVYSIPQIKIPNGGYDVGTIANYFGIRPGVGSTEGNDVTISALPFRAYSLIVNEFFIADYLDSKANTNFDISATVTGSNGNDYVTDLVLGGKPFIANKLHDKFTSCLPKPQAGESVPLPLGQNAPVYSTSDDIDLQEYLNKYGSNYLHLQSYNNSSSTDWNYPSGNVVTVQGNAAVNTNAASTNTGGLFASNLRADLSSATATTINDLRQALVIQHLLEAESRHGNRYFEQLLGDYGVISDDLTLQRPEYLGGVRFTINNNPVIQTSQTADTPQGTATSYSITTHDASNFHKSFKEPGYLICLGVCRYPHSYPQGLDKLWTNKDKFDFYNPHFQGLGEIPIFNREIFFSGTSSDSEVFGYMPYGTELRTLDSIATGEMSPDFAQFLGSYHYGDNYDSTPALSSEWLKEDISNVDRTLDKSHSLVANFRCQFTFDIKATRPIDVHGIPGLKYF